MKHLLAALTVFAVSTAAHAMPTYQITGTFEDGGAFNGFFVPPASAEDHCPDPGIGCFEFDEAIVYGTYAVAPILASTQDVPDVVISFMDYQLLDAGTDGNLIRFLFGAITTTLPEWLLIVDFQYFGNASLDTPWDGNPAAIGSFLGGYIDNDQGYNSPISDSTLVPVSISVPPAIWMMGLGMFGLIAIRRSRFTD